MINNLDNPGTIALVAGDEDYVPILKLCHKRRWKVEIYFWDQAATALKTMDGAQFFSLTPYFDQLTFLANERD